MSESPGYVRWRIAQLLEIGTALRFAWHRTWVLGLGDAVMARGRRWILAQGVCAPSWDCWDPITRSESRIHENEMRKERAVSNYARSFRSGWRFHMGYWFAIGVGRRLGINGAFYGTPGYLARRQRRFDRKRAKRRLPPSSTPGSGT